MKLSNAGRWLLTGATALFVSASLAQVPAERLAACGACHGADGHSALPGVPSLAAQPRIFLENYLVLTREGIRGSEVMQALLKGLTDREIVALAIHYNRLAPKPPGPATDPARVQRGREVADRHYCGSCHLPDYSGQQQVPRLAAQREDFLYESMVAYQQNKRPGGDTMMAASLYGLTDADLKALAHYLAHLK